MSEPSAGWVLYDGACGVCRRWVPFWAPVLERRGFSCAPLQADWVREALDTSSETQLLRDIRVLSSDGTVYAGADAYRHVMRRIWWARPIHALSILPGGRWIFDRAYRTFAAHRYRVSKTCGLDGPSS